jgi:hypothetical protein
VIASATTDDAALQPILAAHEAAVLALNNAHAVELSWLDAARLAHLLQQAFHARRIGTLDAFLIAFDQAADYDSPNYLWFRQRYARFVYVDRVVVAAAAMRAGSTPTSSPVPAMPATTSWSAR